VHVADLIERPAMLSDFKLVVLPGGFSFGDEIASGRVLALKMKEKLGDHLKRFIDNDCLLMAVCNGFQVAVQLGLLPESDGKEDRRASLVHNNIGKFINRWVKMTVDSKVKCLFLEGLSTIELPIRHGEGQLVIRPEQSDYVKRFACLRYDEDVNGSFDRIAGLTNSSGTVFGLMPHPEAYVAKTQHPAWTSEASLTPGKAFAERVRTLTLTPSAVKQSTPSVPYGLSIFQNARKALG
jgi:phosphoribosylformylglycinamidine synthase